MADKVNSCYATIAPLMLPIYFSSEFIACHLVGPASSIFQQDTTRDRT